MSVAGKEEDAAKNKEEDSPLSDLTQGLVPEGALVSRLKTQFLCKEDDNQSKG